MADDNAPFQTCLDNLKKGDRVKLFDFCLRERRKKSNEKRAIFHYDRKEMNLIVDEGSQWFPAGTTMKGKSEKLSQLIDVSNTQEFPSTNPPTLGQNEQWVRRNGQFWEDFASCEYHENCSNPSRFQLSLRSDKAKTSAITGQALVLFGTGVDGLSQPGQTALREVFDVKNAKGFYIQNIKFTFSHLAFLVDRDDQKLPGIKVGLTHLPLGSKATFDMSHRCDRSAWGCYNGKHLRIESRAVNTERKGCAAGGLILSLVGKYIVNIAPCPHAGSAERSMSYKINHSCCRIRIIESTNPAHLRVAKLAADEESEDPRDPDRTLKRKRSLMDTFREVKNEATSRIYGTMRFRSG